MVSPPVPTGPPLNSCPKGTGSGSAWPGAKLSQVAVNMTSWVSTRRAMKAPAAQPVFVEPPTPTVDEVVTPTLVARDPPTPVASDPPAPVVAAEDPSTTTLPPQAAR